MGPNQEGGNATLVLVVGGQGLVAAPDAENEIRFLRGVGKYIFKISISKQNQKYCATALLRHPRVKMRKKKKRFYSHELLLYEDLSDPSCCIFHI